jgi:chemotaxis signal transduction protein
MTGENKAAPVHDVMRRRAVDLAARGCAPLEAGEAISAMVFRVEKEKYAIAFKELKQVWTADRVVFLPGAPAGLTGVLETGRGMATVWDAAAVLGIPRKDRGVPERIFALSACADWVVGVDSVEGSIDFRLRELVSPEGLEAREVRGLIRGIAPGNINVLDGRALSEKLSEFASDGAPPAAENGETT